MTSTISKPVLYGVLAWVTLAAGMMIGCNDDDRIVTRGDLKTAKQNYPPTSTQAEPQEQPKSPPTGNTAPAETTSAKQVPFYGSTIYEGEVTSVYWYPQGPDADHTLPQTHVKFNHHEEAPEEIWLCGDTRSKIEVGRSYKLFVTFEPNTDCISNWKLK